MKTLDPRNLMCRDNIIIRSFDYMKERGIDKAFLNNQIGVRYPLYYQYCQKTRVVEPDANDLFGYVYNIRLDESGKNVICCVMYNPMLTISLNLEDVIDNYVLKPIQGKNKDIKYELVRFVVYNKEFKKKVEEKLMSEQEKNQTNEDVSVCMEIAAAESIPELHVEAPKANDK